MSRSYIEEYEGLRTRDAERGLLFAALRSRGRHRRNVWMTIFWVLGLTR